MWFEPISPAQSVFPMEIKWLIYSDEDVNKLLFAEVDKLNINEIEFALSNIEKTGIEPTDNANVFYIEGKVTLVLNELIEKAIKAEEPSGGIEPKKEIAPIEKVEEKPKVVISDTSTGGLNVREGPGTNYPKIDLVYPGETYPQLDEFEGWYKIELGDSQEGWVYSQYADRE